MLRATYGWRRFWCPRDGKLLLDEFGYLVDPESSWARWVETSTVPFDGIAQTPCLVLIGEPGIGKSVEIGRECEAAAQRLSGTADRAWRFDLRLCDSAQTLREELFGSQEFGAWATGSYALHLFLDSLDEAQLPPARLLGLLTLQLQKHMSDLPRLLLRIGCRTDQWPEQAGMELAALWGEGGDARVYELAPLRRQDVALAAEKNGANPEAFLGQIEEREVVPFATRPMTLQFLLDRHQHGHILPSSQAELYREGCEQLCGEMNPFRRESGHMGVLSVKQRLAVARRIAAATMFADRPAVAVRPDMGGAADTDVPVSELAGGAERVGDDEFRVDEAAVRETLGTGLFSSRGPGRMGWAHQAYGEFLAALHVVERGMEPGQAVHLLVHPESQTGRAVPPLRGVAAWLASMMPEVRRHMLEAEPDVLLLSDTVAASVEERRELTEALLHFLETERLLHIDVPLQRRYYKLKHRGLANALRPYILDRGKRPQTRAVAITIAGACRQRDLIADLLALALDPLEEYTARVRAVAAVAEMGDKKALGRLKPLAFGDAGPDEDDELREQALAALWPKHLTATEVLSAVTSPNRPFLVGSYSNFLRRELLPDLRPEDLPTAVEWAGQQTRRTLYRAISGLADEIMFLAWDHLESEKVLKTFARAALSALRRDEGIVGDDHRQRFANLLDDQSKRRTLTRAMFDGLCADGDDHVDLYADFLRLLKVDDLPWLICRLREHQPTPPSRLIARLISWLYDRRDPRQLGLVFLAQKRIPVLAEEVGGHFETVWFGSPEMDRYLEQHRKQQEWETRREPPVLDPPPLERVLNRLGQVETGDHAMWWDLLRQASLEPNSTHFAAEWWADPTRLPVWKAADEPVRERIIGAAVVYLRRQGADSDEWFGTDTYPEIELAGYGALALLLQVTSERLLELPDSIWARWAPVVLRAPVHGYDGEMEVHTKLLRITYRHVPARVLDLLERVIEAENGRGDHIWIISRVEAIWDEHIAALAMQKAQEPHFKPSCMAYLLEELLKHGATQALEFARSVVSLSTPMSESDRDRAVTASVLLAKHDGDAAWDVVWPAIQADEEFGKDLVSALATPFDVEHQGFAGKLTDSDLAGLYVWSSQRFQPAEDPRTEGAHAVGKREQIGHWRESLLRDLGGRGTISACRALGRILRDRPELGHVKWLLADCEQLALERSWDPPKPGEVLALAKDRRSRLVRNGDELLDVVGESLRRLEAELQGETPAARDVWDKQQDGSFVPCSEGEFSNRVRRHLKHDIEGRGIVVNREVVIRDGTGGIPGERTDIRVDAVVDLPHRLEHDTVSVIIETKGCWNTGLRTAMQEQLVGRYLKDNDQCQHGLYLVGWFVCPQWRERPTIRYQSIEDAQSDLDAQASRLSDGTVHVRAVVLNAALR